MFTRDSWEFHGQYYDFPARNVIPKPLQKPHPPLWVACSNIRTIGEAGEWGMGALGFSFVSPEAARAWVHRYYNNLLHRPKRLADYPTNPNIAIVNGFMCAPTDEEAIEAASGWTFFIFALSYYGRKGIDAPGTGNLWREYQELAADRQGEAGAAQRPDRLAGNHPPAAAPVRGGACRPGDPAQPGRPHQPPGDLRQPGAVRARGDAGVPRRQPEQEAWKAGCAGRREIVLEELETEAYDLYAHQNEDIVRLTPEQLKQRMAEKEKAAQGA